MIQTLCEKLCSQDIKHYTKCLFKQYISHLNQIRLILGLWKYIRDFVKYKCQLHARKILIILFCQDRFHLLSSLKLFIMAKMFLYKHIILVFAVWCRVLHSRIVYVFNAVLCQDLNIFNVRYRFYVQTLLKILWFFYWYSVTYIIKPANTLQLCM